MWIMWNLFDKLEYSEVFISRLGLTQSVWSKVLYEIESENNFLFLFQMWFAVQLLFSSILGTIIAFALNGNEGINKRRADEVAVNEVKRLTRSNITDEQLIAIQKFRPMVSDVLEDDYERTNHYLLKWLEASNFELKAANRSLRAKVQWEKDNGIDTILEETPLALKYDICVIDGIDKEGNLIMYLSIEKEDIRRWILSGQQQNFTRLIYRCGAKAYKALKSTWSKTRKDDLGAFVIVDLGGYNLKQHACLRCFKVYADYIKMFQNFTYPGLIKLAVAVNMPPIATPAANLLKNVLSSSNAKLANFFGADKKEWSAFLLERIASDQLAKNFGGTREISKERRSLR